MSLAALWLYDQNNTGHIWATHNGGASWREMTLPGNIHTMAASGHAVYAVADDHLYRSPLGWNGWTRVGAWPRYGAMTGSMLAVSGDSVWFAGGKYLWRTADGVRWARYLLRSQGTYNGQPYKLVGIAAGSPLGAITIAVVTPGLDNVYRSANLGQAWTTFGIQGTGGGAMLSSLQFTSPTTGYLVTGNPGPGSHGQLLWTRDAGRTWYPVRF